MHTTLVDVTTLKRFLKDPQWVIVDCRFDLANPKAGRVAYVEAHIPGARYANLNTDLSAPVTRSTGRHPLPDPNLLAARLGQWGIERHSQVIAYDASGGAFASRLWWLLRWLGHDAVAVLDGGWQAWQGAGNPIEQTIAPMKASHYVPKLRANMWLDVAAVENALKSGEIQVWDARDKARYAGEVEPIDPVAGHIPGALNVPFMQNLDAQGRFLPADQLRERFVAVSPQSNTVVHMCGSGVTACHNQLAMEIAGLRGSRIYPGSWSEWIRDPSRNVKKGYEA